MEDLSKREWEQFFTLLNKIINLKRPVNEKEQLIKDNASEEDLVNLEEFSSWDFGELGDRCGYCGDTNHTEKNCPNHK